MNRPGSGTNAGAVRVGGGAFQYKANAGSERRPEPVLAYLKHKHTPLYGL